MTENFGLIVVAGVVVCGLIFAGMKSTPPLKTVAELDLSRYLGRWYSLAHIPTTFERGCAKGTTATYNLLPDPKEPAKLKVSFVNLFGIGLFPGDYWVIELAPGYSYAVVGHPARKYGWVLSRTPTLDEATWAKIREALERAGYRWEQFVLIDQSVHQTR